MLVRVKPPFGQVTAAAARTLAAGAMAHGNGQIELTGRGALQFRGMTAESALRFAAEAVGLGLAVADGAAERRRSVLVSPLAGVDPAVAAGTAGLARALEAAIVGDAGLAGLPAKFGFGVDGGGVLPLGDGADVTIVVQAERCLVVPAGAGAGAPMFARGAVGAALALARVFLAGSARRMRGLVAEKEAGRVFAQAGLGAIRVEPAVPGPAVGSLGPAFGAGVPFGSMDAATLVGLADVGERWGDGVLRLTPWRSVLIAGLAEAGPVATLGLITAADDPLLSVSACAGQPGCASASVKTRAVAAGLRPAAGTAIHVSGCAKGCAHPGPAALTFVGRDGRFDVVRNGRAADMPIRHGLDASELAGVR